MSQQSRLAHISNSRRPSAAELSRGARSRAARETVKLLAPPLERPWYRRRSRFLSKRSYNFWKRSLDLTVSLLLMPFALPLILLSALAIKLTSPGPIFFTQSRTGKGGRRFTLYKLRTMVANAEELKEKYKHLNEKTYPDFKITHDPRITKVGKILRRTSLDELPQIFNVLLGHMSLVGPRPTSFKADTYRLWQTARLEVKPGVTGLWQISGRDELDFDHRLRLDVAYVQNRSMMLDLEILVRTFFVVLTAKGAY